MTPTLCSLLVFDKYNPSMPTLPSTWTDPPTLASSMEAKDGSVTIHQRNLKVLATEMYKISHGISPKFMHELVEEIDTKYHTRSRYDVELDDDGSV